jgi:mono/diheme cytochrome c family protein
MFLPSESPRPSFGRRALRWIARGAAGLAVLVIVTGAVVYALSERRLRRRFEAPSHPLTIVTDSATLAKGARLAAARGCTDCHGPALAGNVLIDNPIVGRMVPANLTRGAGGRGAALEPEDWERAIRHGVRRDGSALLVMPAAEFKDMTDEDVASIIAYGRSRTAVDHALPSQWVGPVARLLLLSGKADIVPAEKIDQRARHLASMESTVSPEFGRYVASGCVGCHGPTYSGGQIPGMPPEHPPARNLTPDMKTGIGEWTEAQFVHALREGKRPDGSVIRGEFMPIRATRQMTDTELKAVYAYLRTLPPKAFGNR